MCVFDAANPVFEEVGLIIIAMEVVAPFGVITACHAGDYFLAKATCASIRHYMPDVPICVIVDGDFSIKELQDSYGVIALRVRDFEDPRLRKLCAGSPRSKLAAIWESPFSNFVCFDSDVVVWGDISKCINLINNDFVMLTNLVSSPKDKANIEQFFYSPDRISELNADFQWLDRPFFCAGAFAAKRGVFSVDEYIALEEFSARTPGVFNFAEQGIFNYLVQTYSDHGKIRLGIADLQYIVLDHSRQDAIARFGQSLTVPLASIRNPTLIHFCGEKPLLQNLKAYRAPFTAFRWQHYRNVYGSGPLAALHSLSKILAEEWQVLKPRLTRKLFPARC